MRQQLGRQKIRVGPSRLGLQLMGVWECECGEQGIMQAISGPEAK